MFGGIIHHQTDSDINLLPNHLSLGTGGFPGIHMVGWGGVGWGGG